MKIPSWQITPSTPPTPQADTPPTTPDDGMDIPPVVDGTLETFDGVRASDLATTSVPPSTIAPPPTTPPQPTTPTKSQTSRYLVIYLSMLTLVLGGAIFLGYTEQKALRVLSAQSQADLKNTKATVQASLEQWSKQLATQYTNSQPTTPNTSAETEARITALTDIINQQILPQLQANKPNAQFVTIQTLAKQSAASLQTLQTTLSQTTQDQTQTNQITAQTLEQLQAQFTRQQTQMRTLIDVIKAQETAIRNLELRTAPKSK